MKATLEPISSILRIHEEGDFGSPYSFVVFVTFCGDTAYVSGAIRSPSKQEWKLICERLWEEGIEQIMYKRIKEGNVIEKKIKRGQYFPSKETYNDY